ncbi:MAG: TolC family protein [Acidobacteriota bacterium]
MLKKTLSLIVLAAVAALAWGQDKTTPMTLEECLVRAMEKNLGLQVQVLNPTMADFRVSAAGEKFLPGFSLDYSKTNNESKATSYLDAEGLVSTVKQNSYSAGLSQLLPTGGTLSASVETGMYNTNARYQTYNPYYSAMVLFTLEQPLLKNFGFNISRREILVARNNSQIAEATYKAAILTTLYSVEEAYWNLVYSIENHKVMQESLRLARNLLEQNKEKLAIGMLAPIEVVTAESEVASREADILQAEVLIRNREDALRTLLNMRADNETDASAITPTDLPRAEKRDLAVDVALALAQANRPELASAQYDISNRKLDLTWARNQLLPDLSLSAQYWSPASSGTQILYQDDNPLTGVIIGTIPSDSAQAFKDAMKFRYKNYYVAVSLSLPLNAIFSRSQASLAKAALEQSHLALKNQQQQIFLEVRSACRDVENNAKRVEAYETARKLAERKLDAEERKARTGLSTNYTVLQVQRDLALAKSQELQARVDLVLSQARLDRATGTSLNRRNIKITS